MARTISEIRARLHELAHEHGIAELHTLAEETRQFNGRRTPVRNPPLSAGQRTAIRAYARSHPTAHLSDIATIFRTNQGRVSEALFGRRGRSLQTKLQTASKEGAVTP